MEHLLSVIATRPGICRWFPLDGWGPSQDRTAAPPWLAEADPAALDAFGHDMAVGDFGGMYFFVCRNCPDTLCTHRYDC